MKLLLLLFALMLGIGLATLWIWRLSPAQPPCDARDVSQERSPDGRLQADVFEVRCAHSLTMHVALRAANAPVAARGDVFIVAGAAPVGVRWTGEREIELTSPGARILAQETRWRDVTVRVRQ